MISNHIEVQMQRSAECPPRCLCLSVSELKHKTADGTQAQYKPCRLRSELPEYRLACTSQENVVSIHAPRDATPDNAGTAAEIQSEIQPDRPCMTG